jgi:hypothetical protein
MNMFEGRVPVYLKDLSFKIDRRSDEQVRVVVCTLNIQPFTRQLAEDIWPPMAKRLYRADGEKVTDMPAATFTPSVPPQRVMWFPTPAPQEDVKAMEFRHVTFGPSINVRSDKETPDFAASFSLTFAYPEANDLLRLAHSLNTQWWLEFANEQEGLINDPVDETPKVRKARQAALTEEAPANA